MLSIILSFVLFLLFACGYGAIAGVVYKALRDAEWASDPSTLAIFWPIALLFVLPTWTARLVAGMEPDADRLAFRQQLRHDLARWNDYKQAVSDLVDTDEGLQQLVEMGLVECKLTTNYDYATNNVAIYLLPGPPLVPGGQPQRIKLKELTGAAPALNALRQQWRQEKEISESAPVSPKKLLPGRVQRRQDKRNPFTGDFL
jgi:hypothetical protein